jgi:hypothetical protein
LEPSLLKQSLLKQGWLDFKQKVTIVKICEVTSSSLSGFKAKWATRRLEFLTLWLYVKRSLLLSRLDPHPGQARESAIVRGKPVFEKFYKYYLSPSISGSTHLMLQFWSHDTNSVARHKICV